jgi:RNA polymerase sigma-70 factor (ECF subfamily)
VTSEEKLRRFEESISPHINSAFNLACWLTRRMEDAEDIVQEAFLRAYRSCESLRGADGKAWLLAIVRNTAMTALKKSQTTVAFEDSLAAPAGVAADPESILLAAAERDRVRRAVAGLPDEFREAIVLRELEGCSYKEIAAITGVPMGTVMSRLARGREHLKRLLFTGEEASK